MSSSETLGEPSSPPPSAEESSQTASDASPHFDNVNKPAERPTFAESDASSINNSKKSRKNTREEIRKMRNKRKKKKRLGRSYRGSNKSATAKCTCDSVPVLKEELKKQCKLGDEKTKEVCLYKNMARSYWERWQWELQKRKEAVRKHADHTAKYCAESPAPSTHVQLNEIHTELLHDPIKSDGSTQEEYIGRGSFAVVRLQTYRGFPVAVKEFLPNSVYTDVIHEASILAKLCHPYLPYLFGVCTSSSPFKIITQFHGSGTKPLTLSQELISTHAISDSTFWLLLSSQLMEAIQYLHTEVEIIHNDIKCNNILLTDSPSGSCKTELKLRHQIVLIDFGKATSRTQGQQYNLSEIEKVTYLTRYPHIAPEVTHGELPQSTASDIYSLGKVLTRIMDYGCFKSLNQDITLKVMTLKNKCCSIHHTERPTAKQCLEVMMSLLN